METQHTLTPAETRVEPQIPPAEQRRRRHLEDACEAMASAQNWLVESERAQESLDKAQEDYDAKLKAFIANDPEMLELERSLHDRQTYNSLAQKELDYAKTRAKDSFAAAYGANPSLGKEMLEGRVTISIRRSSVGHWDADAAVTEGKALVETNPALFSTLFSPIKTGFKKLVSMGIPLSPDVLRLEEKVVVSFHGGDDMLKAFRNPFAQPTQE